MLEKGDPSTLLVGMLVHTHGIQNEGSSKNKTTTTMGSRSPTPGRVAKEAKDTNSKMHAPQCSQQPCCCFSLIHYY